METKSKKSLVGLIILGLFVLFYLGVAVWDLVGLSKASALPGVFKGNVEEGGFYSGKLYYSTSNPLVTVKHSINFIPTGREYYYLAMDETEDTLLLIRAGKNFGENFSGLTSAEGVKVSGRVNKCDFKVHREILNTIQGSLDASSLVYSRDSQARFLYLDTQCGFQALLRLISSFLIGAAVVVLLIMTRSDRVEPKSSAARALGITAGILFLAGCILMIYTLSFFEIPGL